MYCPKCKYISYDHMDTCPKCGLDWSEERKKLGIEWLEPAVDGWLESDLKKADPKNDEPDSFSSHSYQVKGWPGQESVSSKDQDKTAEQELHPSQGSADISDTDPGIEPEPEFQFQEKPAAGKKPVDTGQDYEIDYPDLEIIDSDENKP